MRFAGLCFFLSTCLSAQAVVSVRAGVVHFVEGTVFLDDKPIEQQAGKFCEMKQASRLRTTDGRAEVLLTPGVFLRIAEDSEVRMISNRLDNTRVELLKGPAVIEAAESSPDTQVTIILKNYEVKLNKQGSYRFNMEPAEVRVNDGEAL